MYRLIVESLLELRLEFDQLRFSPCLPADWKAFKFQYRYRETVYHIVVLQTLAKVDAMTITVDGVYQRERTIPLIRDHEEHSVEIRIQAVDA